MNINELIAYLTQEWSKGGSRPTTMVLVKLVYLIDLFTFRETRKTFTGWPWYFHHFGPYCTDSFKSIEEAVKRGYVLSDQHDSRFDEEATYKTFYRDSEDDELQPSRVGLPLRAATELTRTLRALRYDPNKLLNYVYHQTEPMRGALPQSALSFESAQWVEKDSPSQLIKLSGSKVKKAQALLAKLNLGPVQIKAAEPIYDSAYATAINSLNSLDSSPELDLSGTASLKSLFQKG